MLTDKLLAIDPLIIVLYLLVSLLLGASSRAEQLP